jgi:hypothetical protein
MIGKFALFDISNKLYISFIEINDINRFSFGFSAQRDGFWLLLPEGTGLGFYRPKGRALVSTARRDRPWLLPPKGTGLGFYCPKGQALASTAQRDGPWLLLPEGTGLLLA